MIAPENELENKEKELEQREKAVEAKTNASYLILAAGLGLAAGAILSIRFVKTQTIQVMPPPDIYAKLWKEVQTSGVPGMITQARQSVAGLLELPPPAVAGVKPE
jgi:hypothetical protein